jgi:hypothetical protein
MLDGIKKYALIIVGLVVFGWLSTNLIEVNTAGHVLVIQGLNGELKVVKEAGPCWQGGGSVTPYTKSNQIWFSDKEDEGGVANGSININFNDLSAGKVSGSARWFMPLDDANILKLHTEYGSQESIEFKLIKQILVNSIGMSGTLMSAKESTAEKKSALLNYIEDQSNFGIYKTKIIASKDTITDNNVKLLEPLYKDGVILRLSKSPATKYGLVINTLTINGISYSETVTKQIADQQKLVMAVQTSKANAQKSIQDAITTKSQGEAKAATAKWEQEVIKAKLVTEAETRRAVAELGVETARLGKMKEILEGEGIAAKKRLIMNADGALTQKLATYEKVQGYWANAFQNYTGALVPQYVSGGAGSGNAGFNFMELMGAKAAKDLGLSLSNKK